MLLFSLIFGEMAFADYWWTSSRNC